MGYIDNKPAGTIEFSEGKAAAYVSWGAIKKEFRRRGLYKSMFAHAINQEIDRGILVCRTGIGMSIACNKVKGVRCAKVDNVEDAALTRLDNDSNVIAISYVKDITEIKEIIKTFLEMKFSEEERHKRRINLIDTYGEM